MLPKVAVPAAIVPAVIIILGPSGTQSDTSMVKTSKQSVKWYRDMIT